MNTVSEHSGNTDGTEFWNSLFTAGLSAVTEPVRYNNSSLAILGSCLDVLPQIKSSSFDLIFADPPYNINKDFGNNKDSWKSTGDYISWCKTWLTECMRILKDSGTMYFMTATQFMPYLDIFMSERYNVISRIVWTYDSSGVQAKTVYGSLYEPILMVNKARNLPYTFNAQDILVEAKTGAERSLIDYRKDPPAPYSTVKVPGNVWYFNRVRYRMAEYENHPTQKPLALLERIIHASSNEGDTVFDPFSGSFTTSAAAGLLKRKAAGIEMNEEFFKAGLLRTGITDEYNGEKLEKVKKRKTGARSKYKR